MDKKLFAATLTAAMALQCAWGVPARRDVVRQVTQPDGTVVSLTRTGDEHSHYFLTTDGIPVVRDASGRFCYATVTDGTITAAAVQASDPVRRTADEYSFIATLDRNAVVSAFGKRRDANPMRARSAGAADISGGIGLFDADFGHTGSPHALIILVQFTDNRFKVSDPHQYYTDFLNKEGFSQDGGTGSVRDYFVASSAGKFTPVFDLYGPVTLPNKTAYYGENDYWGNDKRPGEMVRDACKLLDTEIDFSKYDLDGDGYVDNIYVIYAGQGEASYGADETIWPHRWSMSAALGSSPSYDGVKVESYGCCNEWDNIRACGIGTFCHEFGHVMGLPDLYSTMYDSASASITPGSWDVMDYGSYNNDGRTPPSYSIFERNAMGWIEPIVLSGPESVTLGNIHDTNQGAIMPTGDRNEFFLFENRQQTGWDTYLPGHGMLVWHIDYNSNVWENNEPNNSATHQYIDIEEAGGKADNGDDDILATYPFPGTRHVTSITSTGDPGKSPSLTTWDKKDLGLPVTDIAEQGGVITFDVAGGIVNLDAPVVTVSAPTGNGFTLSWNAVDKATSYLVNVYTRDASGNEVAAGIYTDYEVEGTSAVITRLQPETTYLATVTAARGSNRSAASAVVTATTTEATFDMVVPVGNAEAVSGSGFTAAWQPVEGAVAYLLRVTGANETVGSTETLDFGSGSVFSIPAEWTSNTTDIYGPNSTGYFGDSSPAMKFTKLGHFLQSPVYENDVIAFSCWVRNAGSSKVNYFEVLGLPEGIASPADNDWVVLHSHGQIANTVGGETVELTEADIPAGIRSVKLVFNKVGVGNMALDDLSVSTRGTKPAVLDGYDNLNVGNVTSRAVAAVSGITSYTFYVTAVNAAGVRSLESDPVHVDLSLGITGAKSNDARVTTAPGTIVVSGEGDTVTVTDLSGRRIAVATAPATVTVAPGFYIVTAGSTAVKVRVR